MKGAIILLMISISLSVFSQDEKMHIEKRELINDIEIAIDENRLEDSREMIKNLKFLLEQTPKVKVVEAYTGNEPEHDFADMWEMEEYFPLTKAVLTVWNDKLQKGNPKSSYIYKVNYDFNVIQNPKNRAEASDLNMVPISVVKKMDVLTPQLMQFLDNRTICPKVMVRFYQDTKSGNMKDRNRKYFRITMHNVKVVFVKNYTPEFKEFSQTKPLWYFEEVGFVASKITWEDVKTGIKYTWDSKK